MKFPNLLRLPLLFSTVCCLTGCFAKPPPAAPPEGISHNGGLIHERNEGYSLLHNLLGDEADVSKLLIIKHVDDPLAGLLKQISAAAGDGKKQLETFATPQSRIEFDVDDLPKLEAASRDLERKHQTKLLLTSSGPALALNLLFTQAEATAYAANLCTATASLEDDPARRDFLQQLGARFAAFHDQLLSMMQAKS